MAFLTIKHEGLSMSDETIPKSEYDAFVEKAKAWILERDEKLAKAERTIADLKAAIAALEKQRQVDADAALRTIANLEQRHAEAVAEVQLRHQLHREAIVNLVRETPEEAAMRMRHAQEMAALAEKHRAEKSCP